jgi:hypothetical protein
MACSAGRRSLAHHDKAARLRRARLAKLIGLLSHFADHAQEGNFAVKARAVDGISGVQGRDGGECGAPFPQFFIHGAALDGYLRNLYNTAHGHFTGQMLENGVFDDSGKENAAEAG